MRRALAMLACAALLSGACAPAPSGPREPLRQDQLTGDEAANSAGARATAIAFVRGYAAADPSGLAAMTSLAGSAPIRGWVHWQGVQLAQFPGTIDGVIDLRDAGVATPVADIPGTSTLLRDVAVQADVTFDYDPDRGDPFSTTRTIGSIRVARDEGHPWVVVDLIRDHLPISAVFQPVGAVVKGNAITVTLDSFVADPRSNAWQFDLIVRSSLSGPLRLAGADAALVDAGGNEISVATSVSESLASIGAGTDIEGLVRFDALDHVGGVTLSLRFSGPGVAGTAEFPLQGQIEAVTGAARAA